MSLLNKDFLRSFGWNDFFEQAWENVPPGHVPARITGQEKDLYRIQIDAKEPVTATLAGRLRFEGQDLPVVGDWVACRMASESQAVIHHLLPRRSLMRRKQAGNVSAVQDIASNIDFLFIATSMNEDLNPRRVERYLTLGWDSGAVPVVLLTKTDLVADAHAVLSEFARLFPGVEVHGVSAQDAASVQALSIYLVAGRTAALVGSSGVGKSTLINLFVGEDVAKTQDIRGSDDKGRHTTTSRHLFRSRFGGLVIDTPGMRELQLLDNDEGLSRTFAVIEEMALRCRFTDCQHRTEPGCAIRGALAAGELPMEVWESYQKQLAEIRHYIRKTNKAAASEEKRKWKQISKSISQKAKLRGR